MSEPVILYTWGHCPYCINAKDLLSSKKIPFKEINLDGKDDELETLRAKTNFKTVPQIFIHGKFIGGFQELSQLNSENKLDDMISSKP